ncbi:MAG: site-specific integrase, partial [Alphaproteobacteria bacterium]
IVFAIDTGSRKSEVLSLDWQHVSLERRAVKFTDTKNGEDRTVPISDRVFEMLSDMDCRSEGPVFTYRGKVIMSVGTSFSNACIKAKIDDFRFHDLRHTFASRLVQADVALYKVMNLTGHKSYAMVQRYAHLAPDFQRDAIVAMEALGQQKGTHSKSAQKVTQPSG